MENQNKETETVVNNEDKETETVVNNENTTEEGRKYPEQDLDRKGRASGKILLDLIEHIYQYDKSNSHGSYYNLFKSTVDIIFPEVVARTHNTKAKLNKGLLTSKIAELSPRLIDENNKNLWTSTVSKDIDNINKMVDSGEVENASVLSFNIYKDIEIIVIVCDRIVGGDNVQPIFVNGSNAYMVNLINRDDEKELDIIMFDYKHTTDCINANYSYSPLIHEICHTMIGEETENYLKNVYFDDMTEDEYLLMDELITELMTIQYFGNTPIWHIVNVMLNIQYYKSEALSWGMYALLEELKEEISKMSPRRKSLINGKRHGIRI